VSKYPAKENIIDHLNKITSVSKIQYSTLRALITEEVLKALSEVEDKDIQAGEQQPEKEPEEVSDEEAVVSEPSLDKTTLISRDQAAELIRATYWPEVYDRFKQANPDVELKDKNKVSGGKTFTVTFIKRTDGTERVLNARLGVKKYLRGGELNYDPTEKKLIPVYDMAKGGYRTVPIESIKRLVVGGVIYTVS
jgi:hypothetical protein